MKTCSLKKDWKLLQKPLFWDKEYAAQVLEEKNGWLSVKTLPCDVHMPLIEAGIIGDPNIADNCLQSEWIEERSWWFQKTFLADEEILSSDKSELYIESLDVHADLFLNGTWLGHHASAMYPFRKDVHNLLKLKENILLIRLTNGTEYVNRKDIDAIIDYTSFEYRSRRKGRGEERRTFVRKPQYVYGWDMTPRIATCGIMGDVRIDVFSKVVIRGHRFETISIRNNTANLFVEVEIENTGYITTAPVTVNISLEQDGNAIFSQERHLMSVSGMNYVPISFSLENPRLWWPNGMGDQNLCILHVSVVSDEEGKDSMEKTVGIRTIELCQEQIAGKEWSFYFKVNNIPFFCKGANMFTLDSIYARITPEQEEKSMREARDAGMNMLRFNGVSTYEKDSLYDCCDRYGILVWQDFCFSCSAYPDDHTDFCMEVEKEAVYQIKRLRNHPCIALWGGNNECQVTVDYYHGGDFFHGEKKPVTTGGTYLFNHLFPRLVHQLSSGIDYWNSSPFGGSVSPGDIESGDAHFWPTLSETVPQMEEDSINPFVYDTYRGKFSSEFGCIGAPKKSSIQQYYGSSDIDMTSEIWKHHMNTFDIGYVHAGIKKHYTEKENLTLDEYLLYSGLYQGLMVGYGIDSFRVIEHVAGALIWCLTDDWGSICFSLLDHEINRKIAYYFTKRAFSPVRLIFRKNGEWADLYCTNDSPAPYSISLEYGKMSFLGEKSDTQFVEIIISPFTKSIQIAKIPLSSFNPNTNIIYALPLNDERVSAVTLYTLDFKKVQLPRKALIQILECIRDNDSLSFIVTTDVFAHAVHFDLPSEVRLSDDYFDLLPGEIKKIVIYDAMKIKESDLHPKSVYWQQR